MRRPALAAIRAALLAGPTVLAFFDGGYFAGARLVALVVAYLLLALAALVVPAGEPLRRPALAALAGLALLAGWTALSALWAPLDAPAVDARERALLYLGAVAAAALAFRDRAAALWAEVALAAGTVVVIAYGVLVQTGLIGAEVSLRAGGRLYHPLTYWNAEGALAALGFVLCVRLAGARSRPLAVRLCAAGATPLLGLGVYLSFSRGALTALGVGLALLLALRPTWHQLRAAAIAVEAAVLAALAEEALRGASVLVPLAGLMLLAAAVQAWSAQAEDAGTTRTGALPRPARVGAAAWAAAAVFALAPFVAAVAVREPDPAGPAFGATAERLTSPGSNRFGYWEVALEVAARDPATGAGAGAFETEWLARRDQPETVRNAHSLELETAAELGLIGLAFLVLALGGVAAATRRVVRADPALGAGPAAALALWAAHSAIDWDWELPALTLVAAVLAGVLLGRVPTAAPASTDP